MSSVLTGGLEALTSWGLCHFHGKDSILFCMLSEKNIVNGREREKEGILTNFFIDEELGYQYRVSEIGMWEYIRI